VFSANKNQLCKKLKIQKLFSSELVLRELSGKELLLEGDLLLRWEVKRVRNWLWRNLNWSDSGNLILIWRNALIFNFCF
jgi:hypothetical protein